MAGLVVRMMSGHTEPISFLATQTRPEGWRYEAGADEASVEPHFNPRVTHDASARTLTQKLILSFESSGGEKFKC